MSEGKGSDGAIDFVDMEKRLTEEATHSSEALDFISRHAGKFKAAVDVSEEAAEHTLEMYECYKEYQELYEEKIMNYLTEKGVSATDFQRQCKAALRGASEADGGHREFIEVLLAAMEYPRFFSLMVSTARLMPSAPKDSDSDDSGAEEK